MIAVLLSPEFLVVAAACLLVMGMLTWDYVSNRRFERRAGRE